MNPHEKPKVENESENKEKFTSIERVSGKDIGDEEARELIDGFKGMFKNQEELKKALLNTFGKRENISSEYLKLIFYERPKTLEESEIVTIANKDTNELRRKDQLPILNIPTENIYIVEEDAPWPKNFEKSSFYYPYAQFIVIREQKGNKLKYPKVIFASDVYHEMVHFKFYNALKRSERYDALGVYREGLKTLKKTDNQEPYFGNINEAIVEELTIRFVKELRENPLFKDEFDQTEKYKNEFADKKTESGEPLLNGEEYYINYSEEDSTLWTVCFTKIQERRILSKLVDKIYQKNTNDFNRKDEVFDVFVKAALTGKTIRLWRLIDGTFGKGTFRKIAETDSDINDLDKYVDSLK